MIETFRSSQTPWEVFQTVHTDSRSCFFLDSPNSNQFLEIRNWGGPDCLSSPKNKSQDSRRYAPPDQIYSFIGMDPDLEIRLDRGTLQVKGAIDEKHSAGQLFPVLKKILKKYQARSPRPLPFFAGGLVGYFGYETAELCDKIRFRQKPALGLPRVFLGLFTEVIVFDHQKGIYYLVSGAGKTGKLKKYFADSSSKAKPPFHLKSITSEMSKTKFKGIVSKAKEYIAAGDIYQANLSQRFTFEYEGSPLGLYGRLRTINPSPFSCFFKAGDLEIVSSSPERLIRKKGRLCETRPIAGTCPARDSSEELGRWQRELLQNEKEKAEHLMLVDLERNDLGRVCNYRSVKVEEFMALEKYSHVVHIVSKVRGRLKKNKDALDLLQAMFPGGTITGCPKIRCMQIIDELEPVRRGVYTGSLGYIDLHGDMDLNIVIRTLLLQKGKGYLQVGAGIVYDSDPEKEYNETLHKARALTQALREAGTEQGVRCRANKACAIRGTPYALRKHL